MFAEKIEPTMWQYYFFLLLLGTRTSLLTLTWLIATVDISFKSLESGSLINKRVYHVHDSAYSHGAEPDDPSLHMIHVRRRCDYAIFSGIIMIHLMHDESMTMWA